MSHDNTKRCQAEGCDGVPFFGDTRSPGYCDSCHADRMTAIDMLEKLDGLATDSIDEDESAYYDYRDSVLAFADRSPAAREIIAAQVSVAW